MSKQRALIAIADSEIYTRLLELLRIAGIDHGRALDRETALALGYRQSFTLVVSDLPLRGGALRDFLANVCGTGSLSEGSPVVLLGRSAGAGLFAGAGEITQCRDTTELLRAIASHIVPGDRVVRRLLVRVDVEAEEVPVRRAMQTENLSSSGMLLRTQRPLPVGMVAPFVLDLPHDPKPVKGQVEVVRHADPEVEGLLGMGVRFVQLEHDGDARLRNFVTASRSPGAALGG